MKDLFKEGYLVVNREDLTSFREDVLRFVDLKASSKKFFDTGWGDWVEKYFHSKRFGYLPAFVCFKVSCSRKYDIQVYSYAQKDADSVLKDCITNHKLGLPLKEELIRSLVFSKRLNGEVIEVYKKGKFRYREDVLIHLYSSYYRDFYKPLTKRESESLTSKDFYGLSLRVFKDKIEFLRGRIVFLGVTSSGIVYSHGKRIGSVQFGRYKKLKADDSESIVMNRFEYSLHIIFNEYLGLDQTTKDGVLVSPIRKVWYNPKGWG